LTNPNSEINLSSGKILFAQMSRFQTKNFIFPFKKNKRNLSPSEIFGFI